MIKTLLDCKYRVIFVALVLIFVTGIAVGFANIKKSVEITVDGKTVSVLTESTNIQNILKEADITLGEFDGYLVDTKKVRDGSKIEIIRAISVKLNDQGKELVVKSGQPTVKDVLKQAKISYEGKAVYPSLEDRPTVQQTIYVLPEGEKLVSIEEPVKFKVKEEPDYKSEFGSRKILQTGEYGKKIVTYREVAGIRELLAEKVVREPREEVVLAGRIGTVSTERGVFKYRSVYSVEATAYTPDLDGMGTGYTATGTKAAPGQIAVDPRVIPLGSKVYVEGYGHAVATDTGGAIVGNKIDVVVDTTNNAYRFGRRYGVKVYVLEE